MQENGNSGESGDSGESKIRSKESMKGIESGNQNERTIMNRE